MRNTFLLFLFAVAACLLTSCAPQSEKAAPITEETEEMTAPSREAVFIYDQKKSLPDKLNLGFASEPILLPSGYLRLVGVVSGGRPIACLEIGGRGLAVGEGESLDAYKVRSISRDRVQLERRGANR
jgi:hypothetical protein